MGSFPFNLDIQATDLAACIATMFSLPLQIELVIPFDSPLDGLETDFKEHEVKLFNKIIMEFEKSISFQGKKHFKLPYIRLKKEELGSLLNDSLKYTDISADEVIEELLERRYIFHLRKYLGKSYQNLKGRGEMFKLLKCTEDIDANSPRTSYTIFPGKIFGELDLSSLDSFLQLPLKSESQWPSIFINND